MNKNLIIIFFVIFFTILSLINSRLLSFFGFDLDIFVSGNYEFTKSIFFNIGASFFIIIYFLLNFRKKIIIPKIIYFILILFFISVITSNYFYTNIFGSSIKGHGIILFTNLIGVFIILINQTKKDLEKIIKYIIIFSIIPILFAIKEYFYATFDYGNLSNRGLGSFGHPNYLAFFILLLIPYCLNELKNKLFLVIFILLTFALFLTKSVFAILIFIIYLGYFFINKSKIKKKKLLFLLSILTIIGIYIIYNFGIITKLNSFVSRYYIWETTLKIIFIDSKNIFFGVGNDSLFYLFERHKSPFLYLFENIGYNADRSHNLVLQIFYNFGLIGLSIFSYLIFLFIKHFKNNVYFHSVIIFILFTLLNFASIINYLFLVIILSFIFINYRKKVSGFGLKIFFIFFSIISIFGSTIYYLEENKIFYNKNYTSKIEIFNELKKEDQEKYIQKKYLNNKEMCFELLEIFKTPENYFYCGNILYYSDKEISIKYYEKGLEILPDMWNKNSKYYDYFWVKNVFNYNRFSSEKYSNLNKILERVNEK